MNKVDVIISLLELKNEFSLSSHLKKELSSLENLLPSADQKADYLPVLQNAMEICQKITDGNIKKSNKIEFQKAAKIVEKTAPLLEKGTENAIEYVKNSRLERQRHDILQKVKKHLAKNFIEIVETDGQLKGTIKPEWISSLKNYLKLTLQSWQSACFEGLHARIKKEWEPYSEDLIDSFSALSFPLPPLEMIPEPSKEPYFQMPEEGSQNTKSLWSSFLNTLSSWSGIVWILLMVFGAFSPLLSESFGFYPLYVVLGIIPFLSYFAWTHSKRIKEQATEDAADSIKEELTEEIESFLEKTIGHFEKELKGSIEKFRSEQQRSWNKWKYELEKKVDESDAEVDTLLTEKIRSKIIPELQQEIEHCSKVERQI